MAWRETAQPARMRRVALVCGSGSLRDVLVRVADAGSVELAPLAAPDQQHRFAGEAAKRLPGLAESGTTAEPRLAVSPPDLDTLVAHRRTDLLLGEAELETYAAAAVVRGELAALAGWVPVARESDLAARLADVGAGVVPLEPPRGLDPPTLLHDGGGMRRSFSPLVQTYSTVPYADVDPTVAAGLAYMFMFGMMFGDAGHGALLVLAGLMLRSGRPAGLARWRGIWPFVLGSGAAAMVFGVLYGEFFGPTGIVPVLWLAPLEDPVTLLGVAIGVGAVLLAGSYVLGTTNRWREGGWPLALSAASGVAGAALFTGLGLVVLGVVSSLSWLLPVGSVVAAAGIGLAYVGFLAAAGGSMAGVAQATVELFDVVIRLGTNLVSFARLAAFGLTHAAIGLIVWDGTAALWGSGGLALLAAVVVFVVGNVVAFALEALVAGVQALRLEYYELFSRVFSGEGRPFRPWHLPVEHLPTPAGDDTASAERGTLTTPRRTS